MLSNRLLEIAKLVDKNKVVYDIGSDHGLLPCFLVLNDICPKAYAVDNKVGPLNRTKEAIDRYKLDGRVVPILSDGLNVCVLKIPNRISSFFRKVRDVKAGFLFLIFLKIRAKWSVNLLCFFQNYSFPKLLLP